jgi:YrbI family 3-deoxy-D-manno-octulosonate 8-phosphate phosphatase
MARFQVALRRVRLLVLDVDGVLTDGRLFYGPKGELLKAFHVRDGHGIKQVAAAGITVAIISGRKVGGRRTARARTWAFATLHRERLTSSSHFASL